VVDASVYLKVMQLYADYAMVVDSADWERWPEFFVEEGIYKLQPRENFEQGLPLCLLSLESKAMLRDRVYGVKETLYHDPYYQRHIVSAPRIISAEGGRIVSEANYAVVRTKFDKESTVFNAGYYHDEIVEVSGEFKFLSRLCVYDSEMIPNSVIYPF